MFSRDRLSTAVMAALTSLAGTTAYAQQQDSGIVEEVMVTGIRASVQAAMDVKRDAAGVVDAISAEDIGKFPDTNLAESLQRITGVSIDRNNGEGSRITVRGFGPDFNMVTLNGRTMPGGSAYGGSSGADASTRGGNSRAFDFANLAAEAVSAVEVYKTGKANITAGGIGATVNIRTSRPLENPGLKATVGVKGVHDTTNREGSDVTPEVSGLVSWTDESDRFGVALSASYQERDSGYTGATVNGWQIGTWGDEADLAAVYGPAVDPAVFDNVPEEGQLFARPNDIRYAFSDRSRERINAQLTLQFAPTDNLVATLDYTFAENAQEEFRGEVTNWVQNNTFLREVVFDDSAIATPTLIREEYYANAPDGENGTFDIGFSQQYRSQEDTLESIGLNLAWDVNEQLTLAFDLHQSTMESMPTGPGRTGEIDVGIGARVKQGKTLYFGGDLPSFSYANPAGGSYIDDCAFARQFPNADLVTNCNEVIDQGDLSSSVMRMWSAQQESEVTQFRIDGVWTFDDGRFDFGIDRSEVATNSINYNAEQNQVLGGWGSSNPGEFPDELLEPFDVTGEFEDFSTGVSPALGFRGDARDLAEFLVGAERYQQFNPYIGIENNEQDNTRNARGNNNIEEDTTGVYFQVQLNGELAGFPFGVLTGLRYEHTDLTSTSSTPPLAYMEWQSDDDFAAVYVQGATSTTEDNSYDALLPNLDFHVNFADDLIGRMSFSQTIARPNLSDLDAAITGYTLRGSTLYGAQASANAGNPLLVPLESTNFDLSLEYYFADTSYVSVGAFEKRVTNFAGRTSVPRTFEGVLDQTAGPLAEEAIAALEEGGHDQSLPNLHAMMVILRNPELYRDGAGVAEFDPANAQALNEEEGGVYNFGPQEGDPLLQWDVTQPINNQQAKIHGLELAVQHFFGDTGFGVMANYTLVRGDVGFDNEAPPDQEQFALVGLSDTANLVFMYENFGVSARLAYNWRDTFLTRTNVGDFNNPGYIEAYSQLDLSVSYDVTDNITLSFEGINLTEEDRREYARNKSMLWGLEDLGARYQIGARYTF